MPEAGRQTLNWAKLMSGLGEKVEGAFDVRRKERAAMDELAEKNTDALDSYEYGQNQTLSEQVFKAATAGKDKIAEWTRQAKNGEITQATLKLRMNNMSDSFTGFSTTAKNFDAVTQEVMKRQSDGEAGAMELWLNKNRTLLTDLRNSEFLIADNGKGVHVKYNDKGEIVWQRDAQRINNPGNLIGVKIDIPKATKDIVSQWKPKIESEIDRRGYKVTTTSMDKIPGFADVLVKTIGSIIPNERSAASALTDWNDRGYDFYESDDDKDNQIDSRVALERKAKEKAGKEFDEAEFRAEQEGLFIKMEQDETGVLQPILTEEQWEEAEAVVEGYIKAQLTQDKREVTGSPRSRGRKKPKILTGTYETIKDAWIRGDASLLNSIAAPGFEFERDVDNGYGFVVKKILGERKIEDNDGNITYKTDTKPLVKVVSARDLSRYIKGFSMDKFDKQKEAFYELDEN